MTTIAQAQSSGGLFGFLDRTRTIAGPGFSRWMVPPAALCVHLCIGQAYAFSVFNLPMTKLVGISQSAPNDWNIPELGWIFSIAIFFLGTSAAVFGRWVEEGGPRRAMFTAALCWAGGFRRLGDRRLHPQSLAHLSRLRGARRLRFGHRLHLAGLDADQMVPRPARHGDRHGDHGLRRRRFHRFAALGVADEPILHAIACRCRRDIHRPGRDLFRFHDGRRDHRAHSGAGLEAGRLHGAGTGVEADHHQRRVRLRFAQDAAVLVHLDRLVHQRHRRHRRARSSLRHEPGDVSRQGDRGRGGGIRRPDEPVQHGRPFLLGVHLRLYRPQEHLLRVHGARLR